LHKDFGKLVESAIKELRSPVELIPSSAAAKTDV
jgi:hypothetical protein